MGYQKILDGAYGQKAIEDGQNSLRAQAVRQIKAANGIPIEWHFAEKGVADKMREVFDKKGLNIKVIHTPMDWSK